VALFREDNTDGYTVDQLAILNRQWEAIATRCGLERGTHDYDQAAKRFCNEVSHRAEAWTEGEFDTVGCPLCTAEQALNEACIGMLGGNELYKCRYCGWTFVTPPKHPSVE
jgi:hypothetical protein